MNCPEATTQRGDKLAERKIPWNGGATLCRSGSAPRDRHGSGVAHRCGAGANEKVSMARLVPIPSRANKSCRYPRGDGSLISRPRRSEDTGQTWQSILRTGDGACGTRKRRGNRWIVHLARCWHERIATEIPTDRIQAMDAQRRGALVARAPVGNGHICPLVHPTLVSAMNSLEFIVRNMAHSSVPEPVADKRSVHKTRSESLSAAPSSRE
jgi:hypothetical protein